jgi:hypothetical protein
MNLDGWHQSKFHPAGWTDTERVHVLMQTRATRNNTSIEEEYRKQALESPPKDRESGRIRANGCIPGFSAALISPELCW